MPVVMALALVVGGCDGSESAPSPAPNEAVSEATSAATIAASRPAPPSTSPAQAVACSSQIGAAKAQALVKQCISVSPATHPPCNAANSCAMIRSEIARGCAILDDDAKAASCTDPYSTAAAVEAIARYYDAINARDFATAWQTWGTDGGASGKTLEQFAAGFAHTRQVHAEIGQPGTIEGGAGSLYVSVPVTVDAQLADGRHQHFVGSYALRRINRGMGVSQGWHIETAKLRGG
ncbi:hypothetical protein WSK_0057 [Novosphingobium sp. Rr 2-17]|uniref:hypothetical protein n=1 Tax=Novosphingobium sp. Rr 2-17 TaxID=555793 RepID=UPI000269A791|nr:hypothetical protein [Novosphingobium sp. Rr 2-17]EIZ81350.1 hypothetical protein WSK_0057 [Novosphingobium sp. Rr 2-17]